MAWENKNRMQQNMMANQGTMNQPFYVPPPMGGGQAGGMGMGMNGVNVMQPQNAGYRRKLDI